MSSLTIPPLKEDLVRVLIDAATIERRVSELARQITEDYSHIDHIVVVGVLKGSFIFTADLCRQLGVDHSVDFIALSSYGSTAKATGNVRMIMDVRENIAGKHVLIVEDILDSGHTLNYLKRNFETRQPASLKTIALLNKQDRREVEVTLDYMGFDIPDIWVVGYGLDFAEKYRTLPYIAEMTPVT
ncbi:MAG: hypoxanthine phosphoribosyltransferase [Spirochaetales bacterium]|nr:hypoxanthine phosphoribosyltransferase [Spirochaetales bacterium]